MKDPDFDDIAEVWDQVLKLCAVLEDKHYFKRDIILKGLWEATFTLNDGRPDQKLMRSFGEVGHFLLFASQDAKRRHDKHPSYKTQRLVKEKYGEDILYMRNRKNFES